MWGRYVVLPLTGAVIGWITNVLAIKLLFRPYKPIRIPIINYKIQGLIPKRREDVIVSVSEVIERELLSAQDIIAYLKSEHLMEDFSQVIIDSVQRKVEEKIPAFIFGKIREAVLDVINEYLQREIPLALEQMVSELSVLFEKRIKPAEIIRDKLNAFSLEQFERLVLQVARQELKHIEYLGGVLGFLIGIGQALVLSFL
ncbi:MAG TPA: DUF445 family protein [Clostridia bacterium]|nr:DUF445 family protein [Clostridia bacterium]